MEVTIYDDEQKTTTGGRWYDFKFENLEELSVQHYQKMLEYILKHSEDPSCFVMIHYNKVGEHYTKKSAMSLSRLATLAQRLDATMVHFVTNTINRLSPVSYLGYKELDSEKYSDILCEMRRIVEPKIFKNKTLCGVFAYDKVSGTFFEFWCVAHAMDVDNNYFEIYDGETIVRKLTNGSNEYEKIPSDQGFKSWAKTLLPKLG